MDKVIELQKVVEPILDMIEKNKGKISELIGDIEEDIKISDEEWDIAEEIGSCLDNLIPTIEDFKKIGERK
ncbi:hypothetical protein KAU33_15830 [Candidatus Dependentiae bacterium]|nr:hypothetical protein [Candidatus Dependentiae bacterium]